MVVLVVQTLICSAFMLVARSSLLVADGIFCWSYYSFQQQVILMYFCVVLILGLCYSSILNNVFVLKKKKIVLRCSFYLICLGSTRIQSKSRHWR